MITRINKLLKEHKLILNLKTHVRNITRDMGLRPISDELLSSYDSNMDIVGTTFIGERDTANHSNSFAIKINNTELDQDDFTHVFTINKLQCTTFRVSGRKLNHFSEWAHELRCSYSSSFPEKYDVKVFLNVVFESEEKLNISPQIKFFVKKGEKFNLSDILYRQDKKLHLLCIDSVSDEEEVTPFSKKYEQITNRRLSSDNAQDISHKITHCVRDTVGISSILEDMKDTNNAGVSEVLKKLTSRVLQRLSVGKYPLIGATTIKQNIRISNSPDMEYGFSNDQRYLSSRNNQHYSIDMHSILKHFELNSLELSLNFKLSDIRIYKSSSIDFNKGLKVGDFTLQCLVKQGSSSIELVLRLIPEISDKDTILHNILGNNQRQYGNILENGRHVHPHVDSLGILCLGDYEQLLSNAIKTGDFALIPALTVNLLEELNPDSVYVNISELVIREEHRGSLSNILNLIIGFCPYDLSSVISRLLSCDWDLQYIYTELNKQDIESAKLFYEKCNRLGYKVIEPESVDVVDEDEERDVISLELIDLLINTPTSEIEEIHNSQ
tara:strand:- start:6033 stop:7694 length:1662 start_codon:yes stop_codon:yes gene_type:complete